MINGISIKLIFALIASIIGIVGAFIPYLRDIFKLRTKPHAYTWIIWTLTQGTAATGLWYGSGGWATISLLIGTIFCFIVFLLSVKYGTKNITKGDTVILVAALLAIIVWWQLHSPLIAVLMVSIIDFLGYLPSFRKTFEEPWTETATSWAIFSVANFFNLLALDKYNFLTTVYLITITSANIILLLICLLRRRTILRLNSIK